MKIRWTIPAALLLAAAPALAAPDAATLLARADRARGGGLPGIAWDVRARTTGAQDGDGDDTEMLLHVVAAGESSVVETLEPVRQKGSRMLQVDRNMWLTRPGLRKPVPISPRQRLTGQAAVGDIAATNYLKDYDAKLAGEDDCAPKRCYVLELSAKTKQATYDRVRYWVTTDREVGARAEFYSLSGKLLKRAEFDYEQTIEHEGHALPFVSRMVIHDALTTATTTLDYTGIRVQAVPATVFDVGHLD